MNYKSRIIQPSWTNGFARSAGESEFPGLWKNLSGSWCPSLGCTGNEIQNISPNKINGTIENAGSWDNESYIFNGNTVNGTNINLGRNFNIEYDSISIVCVFKTSSTAIATFFQKSYYGSGVYRYALYHDGGNLVLFIKSSANTTYQALVARPSNYADGKYHSLCGVVNRQTTINLYWDGKLLMTGDNISSISSEYFTQNYDARIGAYGHYTTVGVQDGYSFAGNMKNIYFFRRVLNANEIMQLHNDPLAPFRIRPKTVISPVPYNRFLPLTTGSSKFLPLRTR